MRFLFDENLSYHWVDMLRGLQEALIDPHEVFHLVKNLGFGNTPDDEWIPQLDTEFRWAILTTDHGINTGIHERQAWKKAGHIMFFFKRKPWKKPFHEQSARLILLWPTIVTLATNAEPGTGYKVPFSLNPKKFEKIL